MSLSKFWIVRAATVGLICGAVGLVIASAALARGSEDETTTKSPIATTDVATTDGEPDSTAKKTEDNQSIRLEGRGRQATERFTLVPGLTLFAVTHDGESNLVVRLLDENGEEIDTIFNQIGAFDGGRGYQIERGGESQLDVLADGYWTVEIQQPEAGKGQPAPTKLEGKGHRATEFIELDAGTVEFNMQHDGESAFRVKLMNDEGQEVADIADTFGSFRGSKSVKIANAGVYFLNVIADGEWSVDVEE